METTDNKTPWWKPGIVMFTKVSAAVVIPIILALIIGKYLDKKYNTAPWIFLGATGIAFIVSLVMIWKSLTSYMDKLKTEEEHKK